MLREKTWKVVFTFHTTTEAMAMESRCKRLSIPGRLIPVPREISAGCGMAWCAPLESRKAIETMLAEEKVEVESTYELRL